jgi:hypothetical protein
MPTRKLQNPEDFRGQKFYVGIDVHKKSWAVTFFVVAETGIVQFEFNHAKM